MTTIHPESSTDFEYIQTPAAAEQTKPAFDCGVRTTLVGTQELVQLVVLQASSSSRIRDMEPNSHILRLVPVH